VTSPLSSISSTNAVDIDTMNSSTSDPFDELYAPPVADRVKVPSRSKKAKAANKSLQYYTKKHDNATEKQQEAEDDLKRKQDQLVNHPGKDVNLTVPAYAGGGKELRREEELRTASCNTLEVRKSAQVLPGDSENALGQQNGIDLPLHKFLHSHNKAVRYGYSGDNAGFQIGSLGESENLRGEPVDAAKQIACRAIYAGDVKKNRGLAKHHQKIANNWKTVIPWYARHHGKQGKFLIDENNIPLQFDLRNLSDEEIMEVLQDVRGFQLDTPSEYDEFIKIVWPKKAKEADNVKGGEQARKLAWTLLRDKMKTSFVGRDAAMKFEHERYDKDGVLPQKRGPPAKGSRIENAGHRFKIKNNEERFEL
jgi:hypothetical protein